MKVPTGISTEESLEAVSEKNPVSIYTLDFAATEKRGEPKSLEMRPLRDDDLRVRRSARHFSKKIFKWRNAAAVAAILAVGATHFVFQFTFQKEISENRRPVETPLVAEENVAREPVAVETKPAEPEFVPPRISIAPPRKNAPVLKPRQAQAESAPVKPQIKKRVPAETEAERLRRVERVLTGV